MTGRGAIAVPARVILGAAFLACLVLPLSPQAASACDVSYGYKPSLSLSEPGFGLHKKACSTPTSLTGAALVALLALAALGATVAKAVRKGEAAAGTLTEQTDPAQVLSGYLRATGMATGGPGEPHEGEVGGHDASTRP